jgi:hypothetical protein
MAAVNTGVSIISGHRVFALNSSPSPQVEVVHSLCSASRVVPFQYYYHRLPTYIIIVRLPFSHCCYFLISVHSVTPSTKKKDQRSRSVALTFSIARRRSKNPMRVSFSYTCSQSLNFLPPVSACLQFTRA